MFFPKQFESSTNKEYFDRLRQIAILILDEIIEEKSNENDIDKIQTIIVNLNNPSNFLGKENAEIEFDKNFDKMCVLLNQELNINAKALTVREFYSALEFLEKRAEQQKQNNNHGSR